MNGTTIGKGNIDELLVLNERNKRNNHLVRKDRGTVGTDRMEQPLVQAGTFKLWYTVRIEQPLVQLQVHLQVQE